MTGEPVAGAAHLGARTAGRAPAARSPSLRGRRSPGGLRQPGARAVRVAPVSHRLPGRLRGHQRPAASGCSVWRRRRCDRNPAPRSIAVPRCWRRSFWPGLHLGDLRATDRSPRRRRRHPRAARAGPPVQQRPAVGEHPVRRGPGSARARGAAGARARAGLRQGRYAGPRGRVSPGRRRALGTAAAPREKAARSTWPFTTTTGPSTARRRSSSTWSRRRARAACGSP